MTDWKRDGILWLPQKPEKDESPFVRVLRKKLDAMDHFRRKAFQPLADALGDEKKGPYVAMIRDRRTGITVRCPMGDAVPWGQGSEFWWSDGNFGCDCNRAMEYWRGAGRSEDAPELSDEETPCRWPDFWDESAGHYRNRFVVRCVAEDGTELYRDEGWDEPVGP